MMDWNALHRPNAPGKDPSVSFPFMETFANLAPFCPVDIALKEGAAREGKRGNPYAYLKCDESKLTDVEKWLASFSKFVVCRDLLAVSMALDYDREGGDPKNKQTNAGQLRTRAKPYDKAATDDCYAAATHLVAMLLELVTTVEAYADTTIVVPMPPSSPTKEYDLPTVLAQQLAARWSRKDGSKAIRTVKERPQLKNVDLNAKLDAIDGTFEIDGGMVRGEVVLLVDDLYQSGASMNYVAMKLQEAGAKAILGVAVEKTVRNDDNRKRQ
jgi:hypothetical protein